MQAEHARRPLNTHGCGVKQVGGFLRRVEIQLTDVTLNGTLDWSYLRGIFPPSQFSNLLGIDWGEDVDPDLVVKVCRKTPYDLLVGEAFNMPDCEDSWRCSHWLCTPCLQDYLYDNIEQVFEDRGIYYTESTFDLY